MIPNVTWMVDGGQANAGFGYSVSGAGDVNGDGYDDAIVGAPRFDDPESQEGAVFLFFGSPTGLETTASWTFTSNQVDALLGTAVASADVNGDGYYDVLVGTPRWDNPSVDEGRVSLFLGGPSGLPSSPDWTMEPDSSSYRFGEKVASAGDVNADGYDDVVILAPGYNFGSGRAFLYLGSPTGLEMTSAWTVSGASGAALGNVVGVGDVDADGFDDVVTATPSDATPPLFGEGRLRLYRGRSSGLSTLVSTSIVGPQSSFGAALAGAGDVDGDGYADLLVGMLNFSGGDTQEGAALLYRGTSFGLSSTASWTIEGNQYGARLGSSVASAGDVNADPSRA